MGILLDVGSGKERQPGYKHLDKQHSDGIDYVCDCWDTPLDDKSVTHVRCRQMLEHLTHDEFRSTLLEWRRILEPAGTVWVQVPDLLYACQQITLPGQSVHLPHKTNFDHAYSSIYGWQSKAAFMAHYQGFTGDSLSKAFAEAGFVDITMPECRICDLELTAKVPS